MFVSASEFERPPPKITKRSDNLSTDQALLVRQDQRAGTLTAFRFRTVTRSAMRRSRNAVGERLARNVNHDDRTTDQATPDLLHREVAQERAKVYDIVLKETEPVLRST